VKAHLASIFNKMASLAEAVLRRPPRLDSRR
jgi:hypothetical protein